MTAHNMAGETVNSNPDHLNLDDPSMLRELLLRYANRVQKTEDQLTRALPKAEAYDQIIHATGYISVDEAAKMLEMKNARNLYRWLRANMWVDKRVEINTPRQEIIELGLMVIRLANLPNGRIYAQPMFTPIGIDALRKELAHTKS
ncbi:phage antirepressor KilAC domain-containing protein [Ferrovibrio sp.]|uniref:phage antirepressor KilAC domain-containing protein n=1 Tax=Ferrovibrio sp. TaxID=1917215 RepID=UPI003D13E576